MNSSVHPRLWGNFINKMAREKVRADFAAYDAAFDRFEALVFEIVGKKRPRKKMAKVVQLSSQRGKKI